MPNLVALNGYDSPDEQKVDEAVTRRAVTHTLDIDLSQILSAQGSGSQKTITIVLEPKEAEDKEALDIILQGIRILSPNAIIQIAVVVRELR